MRKYNADVPATSQPSLCRVKIDEEGTRCGKKAPLLVEGTVELFGKVVPIKLHLCEEHANYDISWITVNKEPSNG